MATATSIIRFIPLVLIVFAAISLVLLYQLDNHVNGTLYDYGLQCNDEWIFPYWSMIRTAMGLLYGAVAVGVVLLLSMFLIKPGNKSSGTEEGESLKEKHWNTYKLSDGSKIRIKTVLKGVKRLNTFTAEGKPVYSVKADNVVEVVDSPKQLTRTENQDN